MVRVIIPPLLVLFCLFHPAQAADQPDLTITNLAVNSQCQLVVTLKNQGKGLLPSSTNQPGGGPTLQLSKDNKAFGGWSL